jgi:hypothetical protein
MSAILVFRSGKVNATGITRAGKMVESRRSCYRRRDEFKQIKMQKKKTKFYDLSELSDMGLTLCYNLGND